MQYSPEFLRWFDDDLMVIDGCRFSCGGVVSVVGSVHSPRFWSTNSISADCSWWHRRSFSLSGGLWLICGLSFCVNLTWAVSNYSSLLLAIIWVASVLDFNFVSLIGCVYFSGFDLGLLILIVGLFLILGMLMLVLLLGRSLVCGSVCGPLIIDNSLYG